METWVQKMFNEYNKQMARERLLGEIERQDEEDDQKHRTTLVLDRCVVALLDGVVAHMRENGIEISRHALMVSFVTNCALDIRIELGLTESASNEDEEAA
jgi:hypothetical protein